MTDSEIGRNIDEFIRRLKAIDPAKLTPDQLRWLIGYTVLVAAGKVMPVFKTNSK